jgi:hypothetical protein
MEAAGILPPAGAVRAALAVSLAVAACGGGSSSEGNAGALPGQAVGKFCQQFNRSGHSIELTLELGQPPLMRLTAATGTCAPAVGEACAGIPAGAYPARLLEGAQILASGQLNLRKGGQYLFEAAVSPTTGNPTVRTSPLLAPVTCELVNPILPVDGGAREAGADSAAASPDAPADASADAVPVDAGADAAAD